jgi:hypothetical protein
MHMRKTIQATFLAVIGSGALCGAPAVAADFPTTVKEILDSRTDGALAQMDAARRGEMTECVIRTLQGLPQAKKSYILEGTTLDERQDRFGRVVYENRAQWQKNIAAACADIATR